MSAIIVDLALWNHRVPRRLRFHARPCHRNPRATGDLANAPQSDFPDAFGDPFAASPFPLPARNPRPKRRQGPGR